MKFLLLILIFIICESAVTSELKFKVYSVTQRIPMKIGDKHATAKILMKHSSINTMTHSKIRSSTRRMLTMITRMKTPRSTKRVLTKQPCEIYNIYNRIDPCYGARHE